MTKIKLQTHYQIDGEVEVSDEIAEFLEEDAKAAHAFHERVRVNGAYYSLERDKNIERDAIFPQLTPEQILVLRENKAALYSAISSLPEKQRNRIYAYFFLGLSKVAIAKQEGVDEKAVRISIQRGLKNIKNNLKKFAKGVPISGKKSAD